MRLEDVYDWVALEPLGEPLGAPLSRRHNTPLLQTDLDTPCRSILNAVDRHWSDPGCCTTDHLNTKASDADYHLVYLAPSTELVSLREVTALAPRAAYTSKTVPAPYGSDKQGVLEFSMQEPLCPSPRQRQPTTRRVPLRMC